MLPILPMIERRSLGRKPHWADEDVSATHKKLSIISSALIGWQDVIVVILLLDKTPLRWAVPNGQLWAAAFWSGRSHGGMWSYRKQHAVVHLLYCLHEKRHQGLWFPTSVHLGTVWTSKSFVQGLSFSCYKAHHDIDVPGALRRKDWSVMRVLQQAVAVSPPVVSTQTGALGGGLGSYTQYDLKDTVLYVGNGLCLRFFWEEILHRDRKSSWSRLLSCYILGLWKEDSL